MRTPRRPPVKPYAEARETEFVTLLLAEATPKPARADAVTVDDEDDGFPAFMSDGKIDKLPTSDLARPVRLFTRKP